MSQPHFAVQSPYPVSGDVLDGKYRIEKLLGEGGMGAVAKATHLLRRAPVALKFMSPAVLALQGAVERFVNEGVAASQIDSDHVVKIFDVGRMPSGAPYLVMEFLDGCDLGQLLVREGGSVSPTRAVHFALQMLRALQTAHAAGIIHRDMKPSNCFIIDKDGEPDFVKLVDFGISKVRSEDGSGRQANLTRTNSALGTPLYMSPEQARSPRDVDHRADLYSVGAILYELLTGRTPYTAESGEYTEILFKLFTTEPEPIQSLRSDIPSELAVVIHRALARDANVRYGSASEMAEALAPLADERSAQVITRLRGGRGRSLLPQQPHAMMPSMPAPQGPPQEVRANTFPQGGEGLRPPRVPTDVGVTRETAAAGGAKASKTPLVLGVVMGALVLSAAAVVVVERVSPRAAVSHDPTSTATAATQLPTVTALPSAVLVPSASLAPLPSSLPSSSASAATGPSSGAPAAGSRPSATPHPTSLSGVGFH